MLLGGVPGVPAGNVVVIGGGVAGTNAARMAIGLGRQRHHHRQLDCARLKQLDEQFGAQLHTLFSTTDAIEDCGARGRPRDRRGAGAGRGGAEAGHRARWCSGMRPGSVLVDISIDQGGCFETSRPTTHADPTYVEEGVVHYCVTNMPGAVARTSTFALNNATLPFVLALADKGWRQALIDDAHLLPRPERARRACDVRGGRGRPRAGLARRRGRAGDRRVGPAHIPGGVVARKLSRSAIAACARATGGMPASSAAPSGTRRR